MGPLDSLALLMVLNENIFQQYGNIISGVDVFMFFYALPYIYKGLDIGRGV